MSAARHIPRVEATNYQISIDATYTPSPQGLIVQPGDQVSFFNDVGAGVSITIYCQPNPPAAQLPYTTTPPNQVIQIGPISYGSSSGFTAPNVNSAMNYFVYASGVQQTGPFSIQVANGPLWVQVNNGSWPDNVGIPVGGTLAMLSQTSQSYGLTWQPSDPFTTPLDTVGPTGNSPHTASANALGTYAYSSTPKLGARPGGGNVIIQN